jgi:predicted DNA-binding ribbon-helix-helix protein
MIVKRSITIRGHRTSISIEDAFWIRLQAIAEARAQPIAALVGAIDAGREPGSNLSSAVRLFVLDEALGRHA